MTGDSFEWRDWTFDRPQWRLSHASLGVVPLPNKALELLLLLLDRAPALVTKDEILAAVWPGTVVEEGNIAFQIVSLRKALDLPDHEPCIETVRGRGYRFIAPVTRIQAQVDPAPAVESAQTSPVDEPVAPVALVTARTRTASRTWMAFAVVAVAGALAWWPWTGAAASIQSVAVEPTVVEATDPPVAPFAPVIVEEIARLTTLAATEATAGSGSDARLAVRVDASSAGWRVTAHLSRASDQQSLWRWAFDVPAASSGLSGQMVASLIAAGLGRHVNAVRTEAARADAVALVTEGRALWRLRTASDIQQAIRVFERAAALDPTYGPAYAGLADAYNLTMSGLPVDVRRQRSLVNAMQAAALDPESAEGQTSLAFHHYKFDWRWADADAGFTRAIALNPNYALAHHWYGEFLSLMGRFDESIERLRTALRLEPESLAIRNDLVAPLLRSGRLADARTVVEEAAAANPNWHWVLYRMSEVLAAEGRVAESMEQRWRWQMVTGTPFATVDAERRAFRAGGVAAVTRLEIDRLLDTERTTPGAPMVATNLSHAYGRLGRRDEAIHWIGVALDRREDAAIHLPTHPDYNSVRGTPAFARMLGRLNLPTK